VGMTVTKSSRSAFRMNLRPRLLGVLSVVIIMVAGFCSGRFMTLF
jgi:hypothetical protein